MPGNSSLSTHPAVVLRFVDGGAWAESFGSLDAGPGTGGQSGEDGVRLTALTSRNRLDEHALSVGLCVHGRGRLGGEY